MIDKTYLLPADECGRVKMEKLLLEEKSVGVQRIGRSILGKDINAYFIGNGGMRVIYFGAHHAAESITCNLLFAFMHALSRRESIAGGKDVTLLLEKYTYIAVPCVNPDGVELRLRGPSPSPLYSRQVNMAAGDFSDWQANGRGVDLNHNYSEGFAEYKKIERSLGIVPGRSLFSGEFPESEPETRTVMGLVRAVSPSGLITLHTQGEEIFYQPRTSSGARIAERLSVRCGYRVSVPSGTAMYGGLSDCTGAMGIPSFTLEAGRGKNPLPENSLGEIFARLSGALALFPTML